MVINESAVQCVYVHVEYVCIYMSVDRHVCHHINVRLNSYIVCKSFCCFLCVCFCFLFSDVFCAYALSYRWPDNKIFMDYQTNCGLASVEIQS